MSTTASTVLSLVLPFFVCVTMIMVLRKTAVRIGLLDQPCQRKRHVGLVPLVGGIAMFTAFAISALLLFPAWSSLAMVSIAFVVVALGVLDDIHGLQTRKRFLVQIIVAVAMVYIGGVQITQLGNLFGDGNIYFNGFFALVFTVFSTVGVINAINMVDGADGLAGSLSLLSFLALAFIAFGAGEVVSGQLILVIVGALSAFLLFNARIFGRSARIFMGDAGSMFIGFLLAWFFIDLSQGQTRPLSAVSAGWIFGLPLLDISAVMTRRLIERRSPFEAGRDHIHHLLIDQGISVNATLGIILLVHGAFITIGLFANSHTQWEPAFFWLFVVLVSFHLAYTQRFLEEKVRASQQKQSKNSATSGHLLKQQAQAATDTPQHKSNHP
ncbi:MAG: undecaprenyl/decaprenyl-phosphate alpha-N-acetylglucosaminyl 1-phosphate transferase [Gammaproteobacteria bacterium]|nr:undecaprenyl/decaprenyl-phosphate alpha-N-acetylglucosaminyl 1-phosphate transferase [Gammaproteobacteria bacterium]